MPDQDEPQHQLPCAGGAGHEGPWYDADRGLVTEELHEQDRETRALRQCIEGKTIRISFGDGGKYFCRSRLYSKFLSQICTHVELPLKSGPITPFAPGSFGRLS
jgi:hypothetical protein